MRFALLPLCTVFLVGLSAVSRAGERPNIIVILADDMGYGDVGCYNDESRIPTPNIDRLATEGIRLTDAHSADSVCTPSRYGLLTGRYCWRTPLKYSVLFNYEPPLIEKGRPTLASVLKKQGYRTAISGKWHLGLGFTAKTGETVDFDAPLPWSPGPLPDRSVSQAIDFSVPVFGGPEDLGFDETFYTAGCSTDQEPFCFIENGRFLNMTEASYRQPRGSWRSGMAAPNWVNETVDVSFTKRALRFIEDSHQARPEQPFFLYLPLSSPHSPHVTADFAKGKSQAGTRGDMVWLVDWCVGQVTTKLDALGLSGNTLLIVTSDNGPLAGSLKPGAPEGTARITNGHRSAGQLRGMKGSLWEGGHRVPFIARWPGKIPKGKVSDDVLCFTDMMATFSALVGGELPPGTAEDSIDRLSVLLGKPSEARSSTMHHCNTGFAMRRGEWKIIFAEGDQRGSVNVGKGKLFNLSDDPGENGNLWQERPDLVKSMIQEFETIARGDQNPIPLNK